MSPMLVAVSPIAAQAPSVPPPPACGSAEHRAFDFWVGRWDVHRTDTDALVAHSLVERMYDGCAIRESWMPHGRAGGGSLSSYDPAARRWRQIWVDSTNAYATFEGGIQDGAMVLTGRWLGFNGPVESSSDGGRSWTLAADFLYRPAAPHASTHS